MSRVTSVFVMSAVLGCGSTLQTSERVFDLHAGEDPRAIPEASRARLGRSVRMGNSMAGFTFARDFQQTPGPVRWSPWEGYCCEAAARVRECTTIDPAELSSCRDGGKLPVVCKELQGCSGPECFCCSNGLEHACTLGGIDEPSEPEHEDPPTRETPSVWSPY